MMGTTVDMSQFLLVDLKNFILCLESAAAYHGLITYADTPLIVYNLNNNFSLKTAHLRQYPKPTTSNPLEDCIRLRDGLWVTSIERTICELVKYEREEFFIYEALEDLNISFSTILESANKYEVSSKLKSFISSI